MLKIARHPREGKPLVSAEKRIDILLLDEGWQTREAFLAACDALALGLLEDYEPFHSLWNRINVFSAWGPHDSFEISFAVPTDASTGMRIGKPAVLRDVIAEVQELVVIPPETEPQERWLARASNSWGLVGIVKMQTSARVGGTQFEPVHLGVPDLKCFVLTVGRHPRNYASTFVHELCHALGLADEYVYDQFLNSSPPFAPPNPRDPNIIEKEELTSGGPVINLTEAQIATLRWRRLLTARDIADLKSGKGVIEHDTAIAVRPPWNSVAFREVDNGVIGATLRADVREGSYTPAQLCAEIEAAMNGTPGRKLNYQCALDASSTCMISSDGVFALVVFEEIPGVQDQNPLVEHALICIVLNIGTQWIDNPAPAPAFLGDLPMRNDLNGLAGNPIDIDFEEGGLQRVALVEGAVAYYGRYRSARSCLMGDGEYMAHELMHRSRRLCKVCAAHVFERITGEAPRLVFGGNLDFYSRPDR